MGIWSYITQRWNTQKEPENNAAESKAVAESKAAGSQIEEREKSSSKLKWTTVLKRKWTGYTQKIIQATSEYAGRVRGTSRRSWNAFKDLFSRLVTDEVADWSDNTLKNNFPLTYEALRWCGITSRSLIYGLWNGVNYVAAKTLGRLLRSARDTAYGSWEVVASTPAFFSAIFNSGLRKNFLSAFGFNFVFGLVGTAFWKWPEWVYQYLWRSQNERNNPYGKGFYLLALFNVLIVGYYFKKTFHLCVHFFRQNFLYNAIISDDLLRSGIHAPLNQVVVRRLAATHEEGAFKKFVKGLLAQVGINPDVIKNLELSVKEINKSIRTRIYDNTEITVKDGIMFGAFLINEYFIFSRALSVTIWLVRAYIVGKELGTNQLVVIGLSDDDIRRSQSNNHFHFLGAGATYSGFYELSFKFFGITGLNNLLLKPVISSLVYKFCIVSSHVKKVGLKDSDFVEEGVNFEKFYLPLFNLGIDWCKAEIKKEMSRERGERVVAIKTHDVRAKNPQLTITAPETKRVMETAQQAITSNSKAETKPDAVGIGAQDKQGTPAVKVEPSPKAAETKQTAEGAKIRSQKEENSEAGVTFWNKLDKKKLSEVEQTFLQIYATNLISVLTFIKENRGVKSEALIKALASSYSTRLEGIVGSLLAELTDERIDKIINFLYKNKKSELPDIWASVEEEKEKNPEGEDEEDCGEYVERVVIRKEKISMQDREVAKTLQSYSAGTIDVDEVDKQNDPSPVLGALTEVHYVKDDETFADATNGVSSQQSSGDYIKESLSRPVQQLSFDLKNAEGATGVVQVLGGRLSAGATAIKDTIVTYIPGGTTTLKAAAVVTGAVTGPVAATLAITATAASTVADYAPQIQMGAAVATGAARGISSYASAAGSSPSTPSASINNKGTDTLSPQADTASGSMLHQFGAYASSTSLSLLQGAGNLYSNASSNVSGWLGAGAGAGAGAAAAAGTGVRVETEPGTKVETKTAAAETSPSAKKTK